MITLTVIIPVYNADKYVEECVKSVLNQNFENYEIILVNDCSTDASGEICNSLSMECKKIKVIHHKKNYGVSISRNNGINAANGEYIIFLDSDDYLMDGCLVGIENVIKETTEVDVIVGRHNMSDDGNISDNAFVNYCDSDHVIAHINNLKFF